VATYLWINILSISIPLILSFEPRFSFYKKWYAVVPAIVVGATVFIVWDILFTEMGVWGFNELHLSGLHLANLPLEEWLFFITIPFASLFTYEVVNYHLPGDYLRKVAYPLAYVLASLLIILGLMNAERWYTFVTFVFAGLYLLMNVLLLRPKYLGQFFLAYFIILVPFFIVNGVLTGSWIEQEVVYYNDAENLGIRLFTIPIEDSVYGMLLILINVNVFERLLQLAGKSWPRY